MDELSRKKPHTPRARKYAGEDANEGTNNDTPPPGAAAPTTHAADAEHAAAADASAAIAKAAAAAPVGAPASASPPVRVRRTSAAVKKALSVIADPAPPAAALSADTSAAASEAKADGGAARPKVKLVRTSFSLAKDDHATLGALKDACREQGVGAKKSQLLRVAVDLLRGLEPARLAQLVAALPAPVRKRK